jgi:hypothetical protein
MELFAPGCTSPIHQEYLNQGLATEAGAALVKVTFEVDRGRQAAAPIEALDVTRRRIT